MALFLIVMIVIQPVHARFPKIMQVRSWFLRTTINIALKAIIICSMQWINYSNRVNSSEQVLEQNYSVEKRLGNAKKLTYKEYRAKHHRIMLVTAVVGEPLIGVMFGGIIFLFLNYLPKKRRLRKRKDEILMKLKSGKKSLPELETSVEELRLLCSNFADYELFRLLNREFNETRL